MHAHIPAPRSYPDPLLRHIPGQPLPPAGRPAIERKTKMSTYVDQTATDDRNRHGGGFRVGPASCRLGPPAPTCPSPRAPPLCHHSASPSSSSTAKSAACAPTARRRSLLRAQAYRQRDCVPGSTCRVIGHVSACMISTIPRSAVGTAVVGRRPLPPRARLGDGYELGADGGSAGHVCLRRIIWPCKCLVVASSASSGFCIHMYLDRED